MLTCYDIRLLLPHGNLLDKYYHIPCSNVYYSSEDRKNTNNSYDLNEIDDIIPTNIPIHHILDDCFDDYEIELKNYPNDLTKIMSLKEFVIKEKGSICAFLLSTNIYKYNNKIQKVPEILSKLSKIIAKKSLCNNLIKFAKI